MRSCGEHLVEAALHLLPGEGLDELRDDPDVAEGVLDASRSVSIELVVHGGEDRQSRRVGEAVPLAGLADLLGRIEGRKVREASI